jgi:hypothetical protein
LDAFTDEECERYVARARSRSWGSSLTMSLVAAFAGIATVIGLVGLFGFVVLPIGRALGVKIGEKWELGFVGLGLIFVVASGFIVGLLIRDAWLRRAIKGCIDAARCGMCDYSLLGLPIHAGIVTCPECGHTLDLVRAGLSSEDVLGKEVRP